MSFYYKFFQSSISFTLSIFLPLIKWYAYDTKEFIMLHIKPAYENIKSGVLKYFQVKKQ